MGQTKFGDIPGLGIEAALKDNELLQGIFEASATKLYPIGQKLLYDGRVFRYAKTASFTDSLWMGRGASCLGIDGYTSARSFTAMTAAAAGAKTITITTTATIAKDYYENGYIEIAPVVWEGIVTGLVESNEASTGSSVTLTLKEGIQSACAAGSAGKIYQSEYQNVGKAKAAHYVRQFCTVAGCANVNVAADTERYVWLQTWGPYMCQPESYIDYRPQKGREFKDLWFDWYGGFVPYHSSLYSPGVGGQKAGYSLGGNETNGVGTRLVMLQINP